MSNWITYDTTVDVEVSLDVECKKCASPVEATNTGSTIEVSPCLVCGGQNVVEESELKKILHELVEARGGDEHPTLAELLRKAEFLLKQVESPPSPQGL